MSLNNKVLGVMPLAYTYRTRLGSLSAVLGLLFVQIFFPLVFLNIDNLKELDWLLLLFSSLFWMSVYELGYILNDSLPNSKLELGGDRHLEGEKGDVFLSIFWVLALCFLTYIIFPASEWYFMLLGSALSLLLLVIHSFFGAFGWVFSRCISFSVLSFSRFWVVFYLVAKDAALTLLFLQFAFYGLSRVWFYCSRKVVYWPDLKHYQFQIATLIFCFFLIPWLDMSGVKLFVVHAAYVLAVGGWRYFSRN